MGGGGQWGRGGTSTSLLLGMRPPLPLTPRKPTASSLPTLLCWPQLCRLNGTVGFTETHIVGGNTTLVPLLHH